METDVLYRQGEALRRQMFGDEAVDKRMNAFGEFGKPLQDIVNYAYGDVWSRTDLPNKTRSLVMLGMTAASNRLQEFGVHVNGAIANGCTAEEIRDVLLLLALYCGIPAANDAHRIAFDVLKAHGMVTTP